MNEDALAEARGLATALLERLTTLQVDPAPRLLTLDETAEALAVSRTTVQEIVDRGELPVVTVTGRAVRADVKDIAAFIARKRERRG